MKAIGLTPGTSDVRLIDIPEPKITMPDEVKVRVLEVGICGTDREEVSGGRADAPPGHQELVIGHEMLGQVVEIGPAVTRVKPGDFAVFTVRRGCGKCLPCLMNRSDMCLTGEYTERGIKGMDGYQTEFVVDHEQYIVQVPHVLGMLGVLTEPLSVVEKAIDETVNIQFARLPAAMATPDWLFGRSCLIAGLGPIGLLAALALRLRGSQVYGLDSVDPDTTRPRWLEAIGGKYIDGRKVDPQVIPTMTGGIDFILEATGVPSLEFNLLEALARNGAYVLTGIPGGDRPLQIHGALLMRQLVLDNQVMFGSVNAARDHYQMAVDDLHQATLLWPGLVNQLITNRYSYTDYMAALMGHTPDEIKVVVEWSQPKDG